MSASALRALAVAAAALAAGSALADTNLVAEGRRLYLDGQRADGTPIEGRRPGGPLLAGRDLACAAAGASSTAEAAVAFQTSFWWAIGFAGLGAVISLALPGRL